MDDKQYAKHALILAVISFLLSNAIIIFNVVDSFFRSSSKIEAFDKYLNPLIFLCALSGFLMAIIAFRMGCRIRQNVTMMNFTLAFSFLAISGSFYWITLSFFDPRLYRLSPLRYILNLF
jgi:uncharacterized membrane protein